MYLLFFFTPKKRQYLSCYLEPVSHDLSGVRHLKTLVAPLRLDQDLGTFSSTPPGRGRGFSLDSLNVQISVFPMTPAPHHITPSSWTLATSSVDLRPASVQILSGYSECLPSLQFLQFILPLRVQEASLLKHYLNAVGGYIGEFSLSRHQLPTSQILLYPTSAFPKLHEASLCTLGQLPP